MGIKTNVKDATIALKAELKLEWLNFVIYKYIDTISYTKFQVRDFIIELKFEGGDKKLIVRKQNSNLTELNKVAEYEKIYKKIEMIVKKYLDQIIVIIFSAEDESLNNSQLKLDYSIELLETDMNSLKEYESLDEYFNDIEDFFERLGVPRSKMVPFINNKKR